MNPMHLLSDEVGINTRPASSCWWTIAAGDVITALPAMPFRAASIHYGLLERPAMGVVILHCFAGYK